MAGLAKAFEAMGFDGAWTHINSGNVVFEATGPRTALERTIETRLEHEFGFEITTFVRSKAELEKALTIEPFKPAAGDTYFITFLNSTPTAAAARALEALSNPFDTLRVHGRDVHWRMRGTSTDSRLKSKDWAPLVGPLGGTSRNVNMLRKLAAKLHA